MHLNLSQVTGGFLTTKLAKKALEKGLADGYPGRWGSLGSWTATSPGSLNSFRAGSPSAAAIINALPALWHLRSSCQRGNCNPGQGSRGLGSARRGRGPGPPWWCCAVGATWLPSRLEG